MTENEIIKIMIDYLETQFPKRCNTCGKEFNSLKDYLRNTTHIGKPGSHDVDLGRWFPTKPLGTFALANCSCNSTLAISSRGMKLNVMWKLMRWAKKETKSRGITLEELLNDLRGKIDKKVLQKDL